MSSNTRKTARKTGNKADDKRDRRSFGRLRQKASGRWQAGYVGPDLEVHYAPSTFDTKDAAIVWLETERKLMEHPDQWMSPTDRIAAAKAGMPPTLAEYAGGWMASRTLAPRTRQGYEDMLRTRILPTLGDLRITAITPTTIRSWYVGQGSGAPTRRAHAYSLLKAILGSAAAEQVITANPCVIKGASSVRTKHKAKPATLEELGMIMEAMPDRLQLAVLIAAWCGLRQGELAELRRGDIDLDNQYIDISRAVSRVRGRDPIVDVPKSEAGVRVVHIPPHLMPEFVRHLDRHVGPGRDALLFAGRGKGQQLASSTLYRHYYPARKAAGRPDLRWHDLRHTANRLAAASGASLAELMNRLGHSTYKAALIYQHAANDRDQVIAEALSRMATVTPISAKKKAGPRSTTSR